MTGQPPDCTEYKRGCACWRCLRHFHLQVCAMIFDHERRMRERELVDIEAASNNKKEAA